MRVCPLTQIGSYRTFQAFHFHSFTYVPPPAVVATLGRVGRLSHTLGARVSTAVGVVPERVVLSTNDERAHTLDTEPHICVCVCIV